jgi:hypothetical protein
MTPNELLELPAYCARVLQAALSQINIQWDRLDRTLIYSESQ